MINDVGFIFLLPICALAVLVLCRALNVQPAVACEVRTFCVKFTRSMRLNFSLAAQFVGGTRYASLSEALTVSKALLEYAVPGRV
jgi:hypothetical protein